MQSVLMSGTYKGQSAAPQRSGPAPVSPDVVFHVQLVLHHVAVRPDGLGIAWKLISLEKEVRVIVIVLPGSPGRSVAGGASYLAEEFTAPLHLRVVQIPGCRHGQPPVPYHQVRIFL